MERANPMLRNVSTRFVFTVLCVLIACASAHAPAQAQTATPPQVTFALADGITLHKGLLPLPVSITVSDAVGLRSASLSGANSSATAYYVAGTTSGTLSISFYVNYFAPGNYNFTATAVNTSGLITKKTITVHLLP